MEIGVYRADNKLLPRLEALEIEQARLAEGGALTGTHAAAIAARQRHEVIYQSARLEGSPLSEAQTAAVLAHEELPGVPPTARRAVANLGIGLSYVEMLAH